MGGYDPKLIEIGLACREAVHPIKVSYPPWRTQLGNPAFDFDALVSDVTEQVMSHASSDAILLAGYSFGGIVAFVVAARLWKAGRPVRFLGLLDTEVQPGVDFTTGVPYPPMTRRREFTGFAAALRRGDASGKLAYAVARELSKPRWKRVLRVLARIPPERLRGDFMTFLDRDLLSWHIQPMLRQWAVLRKTLPPLPVPTFLFRTDHHHAQAPQHLGWEHYCPELTILSVPGTHNGMLEGSNLPTVCAIFKKTISYALEASASDGKNSNFPQRDTA